MINISVFVVLSALGLAVAYNGVGSPCVAKDKSIGTCVIIQNCPEAMTQLKARRRVNNERCGFEGYDEVVCCSTASLFEDYLNDIDGPLEPTTTEAAPTVKTPTTTSATRPSSQSNRKADIACDTYVAEKPMPVSTQIIGGTEAGLGEFAHMVSLGYSDDRTPDLNFDCGASLISDQYVLTAAHCVIRSSGLNPPSVARIGIVDMEGNFNKADTDYPIAEIIAYPSYNISRYYDDIALIRLNRSVSMSSFAYPACLNTDPKDPDDIMYITGWGTTSIRREGRSRFLLKANITNVPVAECNATHTQKPNPRLPNGLTIAHICANDKNYTMDTCWGDSGGPLQVAFTEYMHKIVGVTSFGRACGGGVPAAYARVSSYLDWIESIVWP